MDESRIPILIGSGQVTQRERDPALGLSPIDLTAAAVQKVVIITVIGYDSVIALFF